MLKMKIGKSAYEGLPADVKKEYKSEGEDYILDLDGYEDPVAIKNARDEEKNRHKEAARDRDKYMRERDALQTENNDLKKGGSVDDKVRAKETELTEKYTKELGDKDTIINTMRQSRINGEKNTIAQTMASKISNSPSLLAPRIAERLSIELDDNFNPVVKIVGTDGKVSAGSLEDLEKSILTTKEYANVLHGSKGSGGGRSPQSPGSGASGTRGTPSAQGTGDSPVPLSKMDPRALADHIRTNRGQSGSE